MGTARDTPGVGLHRVGVSRKLDNRRPQFDRCRVLPAPSRKSLQRARAADARVEFARLQAGKLYMRAKHVGRCRVFNRRPRSVRPARFDSR